MEKRHHSMNTPSCLSRVLRFLTPTLVVPALLAFVSVTTLAESNDNWGGTPALTTAFAQVGAFALPAGSNDAALLLTLAPGSYRIVVSGKPGAAGLVWVDAYVWP